MHTSDPRFRVLHALRVRGIADEASVASAVGGDTAGTRAVLEELAAEELVKQRSGRVAGWVLTRGGRAAHEEQLARDRDEGGLVETLRPAYEKFLAVNQPFIDLVSSWQVRSDTGETNDHTDEAYDARLLATLDEIHTEGAAAAGSAAEAAERFDTYAPRLDAAIAKVRAGEHEWFARPTIDSYHTVWFQLHEDLLLSQGIERGEGR